MLELILELILKLVNINRKSTQPSVITDCLTCDHEFDDWNNVVRLNEEVIYNKRLL